MPTASPSLTIADRLRRYWHRECSRLTRFESFCLGWSFALATFAILMVTGL